MTTTPLTLHLDSFGPVSGALYQTGRRAPAAATTTADTTTADATTADAIVDAKLVVLLHGWGADAADLIPLAPVLVCAGSGDAVFVPDAPYVCSANPFGRQWFELTDPGSGLGRNADACLATASLIAALLDAVSAETGYRSDQIVLGGFSQGGMVALTGGLAYASPLGGLFCLSGAWLTPDQPRAQASSLPVFLAHGGADPVVPVAAMTQAETGLRAAGFAPQTLRRDQMAHGIDAQTTDRLASFLAAL